MNYLRHYNNLISTRKLLNRKKYKGVYYEKHHIIMKSMGGSNNKENLVLLTAKEHYISHLLLYKIHKNNKCAYALFRLFTYNNNKNSIDNIRISSRLYNEIKNITSEESSNRMKNLWEDPIMRKRLSKANSIKNKGRKHTDEAKKNMSDGQKGTKQSHETIAKRVAKNKGRKRSKEHCSYLSVLHKGRKHTDKSKKNMSNGAKNRMYKTKYVLISPINELFIFYRLKELINFSKENFLSLHTLKKNINKGKILSYGQHKQTNINSLNWELKVEKNKQYYLIDC